MEDSGTPFKPSFWLPSHSNLWFLSGHYLKTNIDIIKTDLNGASSFKNLEEALTLSSLVIYFLNIFTNFRDIVLQSARKLNPNFFQIKNFANKIDIFLQFKRHFHEQSNFSVIAILVQLFHSWSTFLVQEAATKKETGSSNNYIADSYIRLTQIFHVTSSWKNMSQRLTIAQRILSKNALTNWYIRCVSYDKVIHKTI